MENASTIWLSTVIFLESASSFTLGELRKENYFKSEHSIKILQTPLKFMFEYSAEQGPYFASTSKIRRTICFPLC